MEAALAIARTPAGSREIKDRRCNLSPKQSALLILIDGSHPLTFHRDQARRLGLPGEAVDELQQLGLVGQAESAQAPIGAAPAGGETAGEVQRFMHIRQLMNDTVVDALGLRAFFFTLKIERTGNLADLRGLQPEFAKLVRRGHSEEVAAELVGRVGQLLAG
jgi:hypothetical protein